MWNAQDVRDATGGQLLGNAHWQAGAVAIDSRNLPPGALFVALAGEHHDGHAYVLQALQAGAVAAVVQQVPEGVPEDAPLVVVPDTQQALEALARAARARTQARIVAITGSVGKTGSKEALRHALSAVGNVYATQGNLNNHIGVPLCLANLPQDADFGVFELGMNHAGEIAALSQLVRPEVAMITTVEAVHSEFFKDEQAIAAAKAEIMEGMSTDATMVLNYDNRHYAYLQGEADRRSLRSIAFGKHEGSACRLMDYRICAQGADVHAVITGTPVQYRLGATGAHWAHVSVGVLAIVHALGADLPKAAAALAYFYEPKGRGRTRQITLGVGTVTLVDDSYNASPASMRAAFAKLQELRTLRQQQAQSPVSCRTVAVLGDMLELGPQAPQLHQALLPALQHNHIDVVFAAGEFMQHLYAQLPPEMRGAYAPTAQVLAPEVAGALQADDIVLVKGSRGSRMDIVVDAIESETRTQENTHAV